MDRRRFMIPQNEDNNLFWKKLDGSVQNLSSTGCTNFSATVSTNTDGNITLREGITEDDFLKTAYRDGNANPYGNYPLLPKDGNSSSSLDPQAKTIRNISYQGGCLAIFIKIEPSKRYKFTWSYINNTSSTMNYVSTQITQYTNFVNGTATWKGSTGRVGIIISTVNIGPGEGETRDLTVNTTADAGYLCIGVTGAWKFGVHSNTLIYDITLEEV